MRPTPVNWMRQVQVLVRVAAKNHTSTAHERDRDIPSPFRPEKALDGRPIPAPSFKNKNQVAGSQMRRRIIWAGWSVGDEINVADLQPTAPVSWRPCFAISANWY